MSLSCHEEAGHLHDTTLPSAVPRLMREGMSGKRPVRGELETMYAYGFHDRAVPAFQTGIGIGQVGFGTSSCTDEFRRAGCHVGFRRRAGHGQRERSSSSGAASL